MKRLDNDGIRAYFCSKATEKARIRNIKVNGEKATAIFSEYNAPEEMKEEFRKQDNSDGHFFYISFCIWHKGVISYYTEKSISIKHNYSTTKEEGNAIYKQLKAHGEITIDFENLEQAR